MIPFDIDFIKPTSAEEAAAAFQETADADRTARYLSGGTELVTMARDGRLRYDVLIDLKGIPETTVLDDASLTYGACVRLAELADGSRVELLARAAGGVADRTVRNSITLGGNICGVLPYREALLPFLLFDGSATIVGPGGMRTARLDDLFEKRLMLEAGEFVLSFSLGAGAADVATFYRRRTRDPRVDYPLVTLCMARVNDGYRVAVGGAFGYPVRSRDVEATLTAAMSGTTAGTAAAEAEAAVARAAAGFPDAYWSDFRASADYRQALLQQSISEGLEVLGGTR